MRSAMRSTRSFGLPLSESMVNRRDLLSLGKNLVSPVVVSMNTDKIGADYDKDRSLVAGRDHLVARYPRSF